MVASVFNLLPYLNLFMKDKKMKQIHTMLDKETNTWYNKQDGAKRVSNAGFKTQKEAIAAAKSIAINQKLEHSIHRADNNQIREKNSYGNDTYPPKG